MIVFNLKDYTLDEIETVLESLAYKVLQYEHPNQYCISEEQILQLLKEEGLKSACLEDIPVRKEQL